MSKAKSFLNFQPGKGPITIMQCPGQMWADGATGRHMFVTPGLVDPEIFHQKALRITNEDSEELVVVHGHAYSEAKCNEQCVRYPGKVPVIAESEEGTSDPGAAG